MILLKSIKDNTELWVEEYMIVALERFEPPKSKSKLIMIEELEPMTTVHMRYGMRFEVKDTVDEILTAIKASLS